MSQHSVVLNTHFINNFKLLAKEKRRKLNMAIHHIFLQKCSFQFFWFQVRFAARVHSPIPLSTMEFLYLTMRVLPGSIPSYVHDSMSYVSWLSVQFCIYMLKFHFLQRGSWINDTTPSPLGRQTWEGTKHPALKRPDLWIARIALHISTNQVVEYCRVLYHWAVSKDIF